jgi:CDP-paratose 2-epimerase
MDILASLSGRPVDHEFSDTRPGDQPVFIADIERAKSLLGWSPKIGAEEGVGILYKWVESNLELFEPARRAVAAVG